MRNDLIVIDCQETDNTDLVSTPVFNPATYAQSYHARRKAQEVSRKAANRRRYLADERNAIAEAKAAEEAARKEAIRLEKTVTGLKKTLRKMYAREMEYLAQIAEHKAKFADNPQPVYKKRRTLKGILIAASRAYKVPVNMIIAHRRKRKISAARQFVYYHAYMKTTMSLPQIGNALGGRDHTTVLHGYKVHAKRHGLPTMDDLK